MDANELKEAIRAMVAEAGVGDNKPISAILTRVEADIDALSSRLKAHARTRRDMTEKSGGEGGGILFPDWVRDEIVKAATVDRAKK